MKEVLRQLVIHKKTTISLDELSSLFYKEGKTYEDVARIILTLENEQNLQGVKTSGRTTGNPAVAYNYRIMKAAMKKDIHVELHT